MKKSDIMVLIVLWEFLSALLAAMAVACLSVLAFPPAIELSETAEAGALFALSVATVALLVYFIVSVTAGIGMLSGAEWGRVSAIVHAALSMLSVPVGTVLGILTLVYLTRPRIKEYFRAARRQVLSAA